jgi:hypothetical protein
VRRRYYVYLAALSLTGCQILLGIDPNVQITSDGGSAAPDAGGCPDPDADTGVVLCDDFTETAIQEPDPWNNLAAVGGTVSIGSQSGTGHPRSLHAHSDPVNTGGTVQISGMVERHNHSFPEHFFVRFYAYVPSLPSVPAGEPEILVNLQEQGAGGMQLYIQSGLLAFTSWANAPTLNLSSTTSFPFDSPVCIEWEVDRPKGEMGVWLNGAEVTTLTRGGVTMPAYDDFQLGIEFAGVTPQGPFDVWENDLRIATSRVGCSP